MHLPCGHFFRPLPPRVPFLGTVSQARLHDNSDDFSLPEVNNSMFSFLNFQAITQLLAELAIIGFVVVFIIFIFL